MLSLCSGSDEEKMDEQSGECTTDSDCNSTLLVCDKRLKICLLPPVESSESQSGDGQTFSEIFPLWVTFTIPFVVIILIGIVCGQKLRSQQRLIGANVTTIIHGVRVENVVPESVGEEGKEASVPPPTYEKATGEIPPSYDTVLQCFEERRASIIHKHNPY